MDGGRTTRACVCQALIALVSRQAHLHVDTAPTDAWRRRGRRLMTAYWCPQAGEPQGPAFIYMLARSGLPCCLRCLLHPSTLVLCARSSAVRTSLLFLGMGRGGIFPWNGEGGCPYLADVLDVSTSRPGDGGLRHAQPSCNVSVPVNRGEIGEGGGKGWDCAEGVRDAGSRGQRQAEGAAAAEAVGQSSSPALWRAAGRILKSRPLLLSRRLCRAAWHPVLPLLPLQAQTPAARAWSPRQTRQLLAWPTDMLARPSPTVISGRCCWASWHIGAVDPPMQRIESCRRIVLCQQNSCLSGVCFGFVVYAF